MGKRRKQEKKDVRPEAEGADSPRGAGGGLPAKLPVMALKGTVVYPVMVMTLEVTEEEDLKLIEDAMAGRKMCVLAAEKAESGIPVGPDDLYSVGTTCLILHTSEVSEDSVQVQVQGLLRTALRRYTRTEPYLVAEVEYLEDEVKHDKETAALVKNLVDNFLRVVDMLPNVTEDMRTVVMNVQSPGRLADMVVSNLKIAVEEKQELLELTDVKRRLYFATGVLARETELLLLAKKIQQEAKSQIDKNQRELYLRHQLRVIEEDLGQASPQAEEANEIRRNLDEINLPEEARREAERELGRLAHMPSASAEYTVARTYLDWILNLPWNVFTEDNLELEQARSVLDEDHYDLEKVKDRIIEFLAVRKLRDDLRGGILCFVGPPGTGKTSMGRSIARAMGREYVRISLGGIRDEAEVRGHRRTYIGALPGRIISGLRKAGSCNPVFVLDEVDKLGSDFRGDPANALLEVLDPDQNQHFTDHYLDVPFDISRVMFLCTANSLEGIPPVLRDRMEVLELPGYTSEDKLEIARHYLVPKQIEAHGLKHGQMKIADSAIQTIIRSYTREAGLRNLEREIAGLCRKAAKAIAGGESAKMSVGAESLLGLLGPPKYQPDPQERISEPGIATGLAWTPTGGELLFVESTITPGRGDLVLTGHMGEVMKESARAALSFVRSRVANVKVSADEFATRDVHVHVPSVAKSKDGPSAGVTIAMSLMSLLTQKPIRKDVAMTGEITLRGRVLPVGGVKEKVLAARRADVTTVIVPKSNERDLGEIPDYAKEGVTFHCVERVEEMVPIVFGPDAVKLRRRRPKRSAPQRRGRKKAGVAGRS